MEKLYALGVDMGGTGTKFGVVDNNGIVLEWKTIKTPEYKTIESYVEALCSECEAMAEKYGGVVNFRGLGMGAPNGNYYNGTIEHAANLPWKGIVPVASLIEARLGIPCRITNDVNAAAMGELRYGAGRGMKNFIEVACGTGVGSGIIIDGKLVYGNDGFAGELGHTKVVQGEAIELPKFGRVETRSCGCGQQGCIEAYASATGVARTAKMIVEKSDKPTLLRDLDVNNITSYDVYCAAEKGDEVAKEIFELTGTLLGMKLADWVAFSAPEAIILYGGLMKSGHWILEPIERSLNENVMPLWKNKVRVLFSGLKDSDVAILGAASLV